MTENKNIRRVGIFGGYRGMAFYAAVQASEGFRVVCVCEKDPVRAEAIRKTVSEDVVVCAGFDEMLQVGIDVVILANYFHEHCKYAIRAMEAGVDVVSETNAAPTAGDCLDLVECWERTGRKYVLAANCPVMLGPAEMIRRYQSGELGEVQYAEAEYLHPLGDFGNAEQTMKDLYPDEFHWRRYLPGTYYNMHSMGVLMEATGLCPRRVTAMEIYTEEHAKHVQYKKNKSTGAIALYEMENGAIFRSTGCCGMGPMGKWYRLTCQKGSVETTRVNQDRVLFRPNNGSPTEYDPADNRTEFEKSSGHGGADGVLWGKMAAYLRGDAEEPFFGMYNAAMLSLAGVFGHYSALDGKTYEIPDIRDKAAREILRGDYRTPFPDENGNVTLRCSVYSPDQKL